MGFSKEFNEEWAKLTREDIDDMTSIELASHFWEAALEIIKAQAAPTNSAMDAISAYIKEYETKIFNNPLASGYETAAVIARKYVTIFERILHR